ncbi:hypothetical protein Q0L86_14430, partial [Staphylococcus aureus]|nr:hypothetical protein [Staphylococcus aureus]
DERIDVTAATIAALDAELGDGREIVAAAEAQVRAREKAASEGEGAQPEAAPETGSEAGGIEPSGPAPVEDTQEGGTSPAPGGQQDAR